MSLFSHAPHPFRHLAYTLEGILRGRLWLQAILALLLGLFIGIFLGPDTGVIAPEYAKVMTSWIALPGQIFLRLLRMVLIPLLMASIIRGLGGTNVRNLRRIGGKFVCYVIVTTALASAFGMTVASVIHPGSYVHLAVTAPLDAAVAIPKSDVGDIAHSLPSAIVKLIPENPLAAALNTEMLGIVVFSIILGVALAMQRHLRTAPILALLDGVLALCMTIVRFAMWLMPLAVFGLVAETASQVGLATLAGMGVYVFTVLIGLSLLLACYLLLVWFSTTISPRSFLKRILPVQLLAFTTSSSAAVVPFAVETAEKELGVDEESAKVILPLGATVNMAGTALFQSIAILFLAQTAGVTLSVPEMILIAFTLVLSSIGAPAAPGVGVIVLGVVAGDFGIPLVGYALVVGVDRILDMSRTVLNVTGDLVACVLFGRGAKAGRTRFLWRRS